MTLKIGIVGMGGIGNTDARVYGQLPETTVVAVCDIIKDRADRAAEGIHKMLSERFRTAKD